MNIFKIVEELEKIDPEMNERFSPRRDAIKSLTNYGSKVALAALPFALGSLFNKAYGQTTVGDVNGTLNFALKLEYLEAAFYNTAIATTGLIPAADLPAFQVIAGHENAHVAFLKSVLGPAAVTAASQGNNGTYDWTAGGSLGAKDCFANKDYATFLIIANAFEDTGVRAYKGQAPNVIGNQVILTAALSIHSVEARHASHIRTIRRGTTATPKSWITGANDTGFAGIAANYAGEDNTNQGGVDLTTLINPVTGIKFTTSALTEAFDEPLTYAQVLPLVTPFGVK